MNVVLNFSELKLNNRQPVYVQIANYVKLQILLGKVGYGDKLPSRRDVAAQLQVNPNTVQKAFKLMEDEGYVRTSSTLGSEVCADEDAVRRIEHELTHDLVREFVESAKAMNLSFKHVMNLIIDMWDK